MSNDPFESEEWAELGARLLTIAAALEQSGIPYGFGGAIAYNYVGEPRGTRDIDINIFLPQTEAIETLVVLNQIGMHIDLSEATDTIRRIGQIRLYWDHVPVDLFFSTVPLHDASQQRLRMVPFRGRIIPVLSGEDLTLCKVAFNRQDDWSDIRNVLAVQQSRFDLVYVRRWMYDMFPDDDERVQRFERLVEQLVVWGVLGRDALQKK